MKSITLDLLNSFDPCYDPAEIGFTPDLELTPVEFIDQFRDKVQEKEDIIWALCREDFLPDCELRLFAVWCAREALKLIDAPDPRSVEACNVAERYAKGEASEEELVAARDAAWAAARAAENADASAAWAAASAAAWAASAAASAARAARAARDACAAAWDDRAARAASEAARAAASEATRAAASEAARAARDAARAAARDAARAARDAAWAATSEAWAAAMAAQIDKLREIFVEKEKNKKYGKGN